jgi:hypothetical protein
MWAMRAEVGRVGMFNKTVCVMEMEAPSGRVTKMLLFVVMFSRLLETLKKFSVAPVPITVVVVSGGEGRG